MFHNKLIKSLYVAGFIILAGITAAKAQVPGTAIKFTAESTFALTGKIFAAGDYTITRTPGVSGSDSLILRGMGGTTIFNTTPTSSATAAEDTHVSFEKIDGMYFLSQISLRGETAGKSVNISKADRQQIAKSTKRNSIVDTTGL